jgi:predicted AAA+ superfamily ATPase
MSTILKPWREVAIPHPDVLEGTFQQAEFAADLSAVRAGRAPREYQDPVAFYERTYITEGMRLLLTQVAERLNGRGGEPVIQLQTAFGGGKTHTLLAVYHLSRGEAPLSEMPGLASLVDRAGLPGVPNARVAVLDGHAHAPGQSWKHGAQEIRTLWGELAWQLGGETAYRMLEGADRTGTSPGKDVLEQILSQFAPCVVLIDELVAYVRQFPEGKALPGGTYDSNLSFVQALTEAAKLVPSATILASLPESELEAGSQRGAAALRALEKTFGRVQALWKPVASDEAFEIVRRRLFEPVRDTAARDAVCRAFGEAYVGEGARLPSETLENRYRERLVQAYPIHPEVFDRLYEDWTTIEGFQRTRGVLKLMAKVIYRLWKDANKDLLILPGGLPLADGSTRNEFTYYLPQGWDPVIEGDIDGDRAETTELESREPRFGQINAARRVARTLFLGSAPSSVAGRTGQARGIDRARVLLGCLQPAQQATTYLDALQRLADRLHYLNTSGERADEHARYWFDTRANLRREMEDRKRRFDDATNVRHKVAEAVKKALAAAAAAFDAVHVFTTHADVPDDSALRLVALPPDRWYAREEPRLATEAVVDAVRSNGGRPRQRGNRLLFLAADSSTLSRLMDAARTALAWGSIVDDIAAERLNVDLAQKRSAEKELQAASEALPRIARECYRWLLVPTQETPTTREITVEAFPLGTSGGSLGGELERTCADNELVITTWSPIHLRSRLWELYWKPERPTVSADTFWEDTLRYLYLPRLRSREVLAQAIRTGAQGRDFFGVAYGGDEDHYEGFALGTANVQVDDTLLLIEPEAAHAYRERERQGAQNVGPAADSHPQSADTRLPHPDFGAPLPPHGEGPRAFHGSADVSAATAKVKLVEIAEEIIAALGSDPNATVRVTLEIQADFPAGASEQVRRTVSENARILGLRVAEWD